MRPAQETKKMPNSCPRTSWPPELQAKKIYFLYKSLSFGYSVMVIENKLRQSYRKGFSEEVTLFDLCVLKVCSGFCMGRKLG